jgi:hypothetical protein
MEYVFAVNQKFYKEPKFSKKELRFSFFFERKTNTSDRQIDQIPKNKEAMRSFKPHRGSTLVEYRRIKMGC